MNERNILEFKSSSSRIAVVYAPNGTGKTSFTKALLSTDSTENKYFNAVDKDGEVRSNDIYIIEDQIHRNVIKGDTSKYFLGKNIQEEYELKENLIKWREYIFREEMPIVLKEKYNVTKKSDYFVTKVAEYDNLVGKIIQSISNVRKRGDDIKDDKLLEFLKAHKKEEYTEIDKEDRSWLLSNEQIIKFLFGVKIDKTVSNTDVDTYEVNNDAINILTKYEKYHDCIVCDNKGINTKEIKCRKEKNNKNITENLDKTSLSILQNIVGKIKGDNDRFGIRKAAMDLLKNGNKTSFENVKKMIEEIFCNLYKEFQNTLINKFQEVDYLSNYEKYQKMLTETPQLTDEDVLFLKEVISSNINKNLELKRDDNNKLNIVLDNSYVLGVERDDLLLSTGEQNFISLSFEMLLAKNNNAKYVVIDDPISSFDSIYKNKLAFSIIKFLLKKNVIILTHNLDLIRLLEVQKNGCFNLYILNNTEKGVNGFIPINQNERNLLINLHNLVNFFNNKEEQLQKAVLDDRLFLMSMIPFMRGYAQLICSKTDWSGRISGIMHGYERNKRSVSYIYKCLFKHEFKKCVISTLDIVNFDINYEADILNPEYYPLLNDTLKQTLIYFHLRMKVEHLLVKRFGRNIIGNGKLEDLIQKAFSENKNDTKEIQLQKVKNKVFFMSRKTLLNEFNHFEGNMNIFQPAIDISMTELQVEAQEIMSRLNAL